MPSYPIFNGEGNDGLEELLARLFGGQGPSNRNMDLNSLLSEKSQAIVRNAITKANIRNSATVESVHLLSALLDDDSVSEIISRIGARKENVVNDLEQVLATTHGTPSGFQGDQGKALGATAQQTLFESAQIARGMFGSPEVEPEHIFYAIIGRQQSKLGEILTENGITPDAIRTGRANVDRKGKLRKTNTPTLDQFGTDLTELAADGKLDPVIGRHSEVSQVTEILLRRTKNNPVLIGEAGVGKTAIVEGLALAIAEDNVPELLRGKRVVSLDLTGMVAGTKFRGDFEDRIQKVINEIVAHKDELIVFIDELHTIIGAGNGGGEGGMDAGNILKPKLARGDLHLIGATTLKEYRKIEKDNALERRFQPVTVAEPSVSDAILILNGIKDNYEDHHKVTYTPEALTAAVELSNRYISDRFLPDKAIDLIDQAGARKRLNSAPRVDLADLQQQLAQLEREKNAAVAREQYEQANDYKQQIKSMQERMDKAVADNQTQALIVNETDIADVISRATGIPAAKLTESDRSRLSKLEDELHESVIGQHEAVKAVAKSVRRNRSGMGDPNRPIGSFLFLGPTGTGKTQLSKTLANNLFGSENSMIRFDMSEYSEKHTASRLVGAPPGYVGYDEAGQLTEKVRRNPYSVVLFDEIEKAHPDIFNMLLQVLDDGRLTDGQGRTVDFRNTVVIMTSNVGSEFLASKSGAMGFVAGGGDGFGSENEIRTRVMGRLREVMRPEFLNRIDEIVLFKKLEISEVKQIARLLMIQSEARLATQGIVMSVPDEAVIWIANNGYDAQYGARPLRRLIQRRVEDAISDLIINEEVTTGDSIILKVVDGDLKVVPERQAFKPSKAKKPVTV